MERIVFVIPTYWCRPGGNPGQPGDAVFDHPTPLDAEGTLARCLQSLERVSSHSFEVLVITAPVNAELNESVERRVEEIIAPFRRQYPVCQFGPADLQAVRGELESAKQDPGLVSLEAYAQIRNCQLLGAALLDAGLVAAIDDDELVPADYLEKALQSLGEDTGDAKMPGLAGLYLNAAGDYRVAEPPGSRMEANIFFRKAALMNDEVASYIEQPGRTVPSAMALGGNMIFTRRLYRQVPFDPGITRGEDLDYLMNTRLAGLGWYLDKELVITHLPPPPAPGDPVSTSPYAKLQQDVIRFVYQREKLRLSSEKADAPTMTQAEFGVYPGAFLGADLETQALEALERMRPADADMRFFPPPEKLMKLARERAGRADGFFRFRAVWPELLARVAENAALRERMRRKMGA
jgi:hypothetical protein